MKTALRRRDVLKALGVGPGMLPLLHATRSFAADATPRRVIFLVKGNGTLWEEFWPKGAGEDLATKTLPEITKPLEPYKSHLIFPEGIDLKNWTDGNPFGRSGDAHHNYGALFTGTYIANHWRDGAVAASQSVDDYIANALEAKGAKTPIKMIVSSCWFGSGGNGFTCSSWRGRAAANTAEPSPYRVFDRLFAGRSLPAAGTTDAAVERLIKQRRSVLDFVGKDLESFARSLGGEDRQAIQAHLQALTDRQKELATAMPGAALACRATALEKGVSLSDRAQMGKMPKMHLDLVVDAMRCDLTRVANVTLSDTNGYSIFFQWLGAGFGPGQGAVSEFPERHAHGIAHGARGAGKALKIRSERWYIEQLAYLLGRLKETPEGTGTMLDNTAVLWADTLNEPGGHSTVKMPWILAGKGGGYFKTGRHLKFGGAAQNGLLVALCNAMGVPPPNQTFGDPKWGRGELAGLTT